MLVYRSVLRFLSARLRDHRRQRSTLLRRRTPGRQALLTLAHQGDEETAATKAFVILDGTLLPIDRITADRPFFSGDCC